MSRRWRGRGGDHINSLIAAEEDGSRLDKTEIVGVCRPLLMAGNVTTRDLIGNSVTALLAHPGELAKLRDNPRRIGPAIDEIRSYASIRRSCGRPVRPSRRGRPAAVPWQWDNPSSPCSCRRTTIRNSIGSRTP